MRGIFKYSVKLVLPEPLQPLLDIAYNLWWTWNPDAVRLFEQADRELWEKTRHNPVRMMGLMPIEQYAALMDDAAFMAHLRRVRDDLARYMNRPTWHSKSHPESADATIAYFSAEFGLHECLPIYSGGLGVLSGDHLKSASDLGLPLVGIGLCYRHGYFSQYLTADGWQMESYPLNDFFNMPVQMETDAQGDPLTIRVPLHGRDVWARIWRVQVGRVPLYLLDTDLDRNAERDRAITSHLYGGGLETRIEQEILLGIGGIRALAALDRNPTVCHINEGHSAFLALERIRRLVAEEDLSFEVAREFVANTTLFTTHTPVPAGIDKFPPDMIRAYFRDYARELGIPMEDLLRLGQENPAHGADLFNMAVLALRLSAHANGVSRLHGKVSRRMWASLWPEVPVEEIPIFHITNGIHAPTWLSKDLLDLYAKHLGGNWLDDPTNQNVWNKVESIPSEALWRVHGERKQALIAFARHRLKEQLGRSGAHPKELSIADEALDPDVLTIGFARRFATYKRATLLLRDLDRLRRLVTDPKRPVQFVFAGKAHPRDHQGKEFIRQIVQVSRQPDFRRRIVFVQDYDMLVARHMVQGVDVWLNTPRRPLEASGTSGMKSSANGVLNFSVLDGWWDEGYNGNNGWVIGEGEDYEDHEYQDNVEGHGLYNLLEKTIIPLYYDRGKQGFPTAWTRMMKESVASICPFFNTSRMVEEYARTYYIPDMERGATLSARNYAKARELSRWKTRTADGWKVVRVVSVEADVDDGVRIGEMLPVRARVHLGPFAPEEAVVEVCHGSLDEKSALRQTGVVRLEYRRTDEDASALYEGRVPCQSTGERGLMVRVLPSHPVQPHEFYTGAITWWEG